MIFDGNRNANSQGNADPIAGSDLTCIFIQCFVIPLLEQLAIDALYFFLEGKYKS